MSYDRPLSLIANGVIDSRGRFYSFQLAQVIATGVILPSIPGVRYFIHEIDLDGASDGVAASTVNSVTCTIEKVTRVVAVQCVPLTIAAVSGVSDESVSYPHVLTDAGTAVTVLLGSKLVSALIVYAAVDENQDAKVLA